MADETKIQAQQQQSQLQQQHQMTDSNGQVSLTIRLLMLGKEVGGIIGKKGDNIKRFREESGAKINISDGSCPERIVTLSGSVHEVFKAFSMICHKFEEGLLTTSNVGVIQIGSNSNPAGAASNAIDANNLLGATTNQLGASIDQSVSSMFGLAPNNGLLNSALKDGSLTGKDTDMLTMNNNNTSTVNNNNSNSSSTGKIELNAPNTSRNTAPLVTLRLIIPASQCGSLIGRGGGKIKEIREMTGATVQVAADVLPNSTERVVTITGNVESLTRCAYQICNIMVESPPKGYTIQYRPKPVINPMLFAAASAGQATAYNLPGQYALSTHPDINRLFVTAGSPLATAFTPAVSLRAAAASAAVTNQAAAALSAIGSQTISSSHEMVIPNGLIGCVIGKGGSKINEIRQLSGATIKISNSEEGTKNRTVTINGTPEAINLAQYLITASCTGASHTLFENPSKTPLTNKMRKYAPY